MNKKANVDAGIVFLAFLLIIVLIIAYAYHQNQQYTSVNANPYFTVTPDHIDWGNVSASTVTFKTVTITNTANYTSAPFNMTHNAPDYILLWWDSENVTITPFGNHTAGFALIPTANATEGPFTFDITLRG